MKLYAYFRSSASYRVNIALHLKKLEHDYCAVNLLQGEQLQSDYQTINPQTYVPALETEHGIITQSLAIIEYLEERYPSPALLPKDPWQRATIRSMALQIACDIHPLNNVSVLNYLTQHAAFDDQRRDLWYSHWVQKTFTALEKQVQNSHGRYCHGDHVTIADLCLVPQMYNARRYHVNLNLFPTLTEIDQRLNELPEFQAALPDRQLDSTL